MRAYLLAAVVAGGLAAGAGASAADPPELARLRRYLAEYQRAFAAILADEVAEQLVERRDRTASRRETRGEFFTTFVTEDAVWMSVHDISEVDGALVKDRPDLRRLLSSTSIRRVAPQLAAVNARYNIGSVTRNVNEPTLALQLAAPRRAGDVSFSRERVERTASGSTLVTLGVRVRETAAFIGSPAGRRVSTRGTFIVEPDTGRVRRTTLAFDDGRIRASHETSYAPDERTGLWLPATFTETYRDGPTGEVTTVRTTFSNYRRFEASGRMLD